MKRAALFLVVALLFVVGFWLARRSQDKSPPAATPSVTKVTESTVIAVTIPSPSGQPVLLGETILRDYANTNHPAENDLTLISRLMENSLLLLKSAANRPLSANEDWAGMLLGENAAHERFLPADHVALNAQGQLVDRWRTPLFFHSLGGGRFELRSAGPDKKLWTADDLHRNADGSFRRGAELNSPSLLEAATSRSPSRQ